MEPSFLYLISTKQVYFVHLNNIFSEREGGGLLDLCRCTAPPLSLTGPCRGAHLYCGRRWSPQPKRQLSLRPGRIPACRRRFSWRVGTWSCLLGGPSTHGQYLRFLASHQRQIQWVIFLYSIFIIE